ncbi:MAG: OsmC family protein [Thaumarchaeota archaeon]|nr:OsmC family protein [Nitrososphaerota archaeon]
MIKFEEGVIERTRRTMAYVKEHEPELTPRTITVKLEKNDNFLSTASREGSDLVWYSDESKERGGEEKGASPLSYLLSSMGFCQFVHYAEHSIVDGLKLDSLQMKVSGKISMQPPRRFTEITYEVSIASPESAEAIKSLARKAADDCYVTNTLKRACTVTGIIMHNGAKIDQH